MYLPTVNNIQTTASQNLMLFLFYNCFLGGFVEPYLDVYFRLFFYVFLLIAKYLFADFHLM